MIDVVKVVVSGARGPASEVPGPPGTVTDASGFLGALAIASDARKPHTVRAADTVNISTVDVRDTYSGNGTATKGAGRFFFGTLPPQNDDAAICVGRDVVGLGLFSHAFRDESVVKIGASGAYTAFDARQTYASNGDGTKLNHGYAAQASHQMSAAGGIDLFAGFVTNPRVTAGTVDRLYHFHVQGMTKTGGTVVQHVGIYISPLSGGNGGNYAIFQESPSNPNYFAGDTQFGGAVTGIVNLTITKEVKAGAVQALGTIDSFGVAGGVVIAGKSGASDYGTIRAYGNSAGAPKGLSLNPTGGQVLIGRNGVPVTGEGLEVEGLIGTGEAYRVDGVKVVGNRVTGVAVTVEAIHAALVAHGLIAA